MLADWTEFEEYMNTLLRAGTIRSIKEVWWDVRPHPDFGTVEIRIFDGVPALHEAGMAGALSPSLVHRFGTQLDRGGRLPSGGLTDVVDALVTELAEDRFVRPGEGRYAGP